LTQVESHVAFWKRGSGRSEADWRRGLKRRLAWLLAIKFAALMLMWYLFFSPPHRQHIDGEAASERLAVSPGMNTWDKKLHPEEDTHD